MMVFDDLRDGRSIRADDDLIVVNLDSGVQVVRVRGPQKDQQVLRTFTGPTAKAEARQYQKQMMIRAGR